MDERPYRPWLLFILCLLPAAFLTYLISKGCERVAGHLDGNGPFMRFLETATTGFEALCLVVLLGYWLVLLTGTYWRASP
jgi:hypothetical protein